MHDRKRIALIGGGPSALMVFKQLVESEARDIEVTVFEAHDALGRGMPYSRAGAGTEHITNVSGNEIPEFDVSLTEWVKTRSPGEHDFHEGKVLPRLLFGLYLEECFQALQGRGVPCEIHLQRRVSEVRAGQHAMEIELADGERRSFDYVVVCTGHYWPRRHEGKVEGWYDSPYPPAKLQRRFNHAVALRGSSLTAIDAVRTLAAHNGSFDADGRFQVAPGNEGFRIVMHTRNGLLPCLRFRLDDPRVTNVELFSPQEIEELRRENQGFVPLDAVYDRFFRQLLRERYPETAERVGSLSLEQFVARAMRARENRDPFELFAEECAEARLSHCQRRTVAWKEILAVLSYALNYPAKYFSAEDSLRLHRLLLPLISIVIAFIPESSAQVLLALHQAGRLELIEVGEDSSVEPASEGGALYRIGENTICYQTFIDCVGQPHLPLSAYPFRQLIETGVLSQARLEFRSQQAARGLEEDVCHEGDRSWLIVPGAAINDDFQPLGREGQPHPRLYLMAVPFMGGHNPDYSGLDFCEEASRRIVRSLLATG